MATDFYVYEHWRPDTGMPFWVGKGSGARSKNISRRNAHHRNIVAKLKRLGLSVEVEIVRRGLSEIDAHTIEIGLIAFWRTSGIKLANITLGGEGVSGLKHSQETREKMRIMRQKQSREAHRAVMKGRKHSEEHRNKIVAKLTGRPVSVETREKISRSNLGQRRPESARANMRAAQLGKKQSAETIEKRRQSLRRYWETADRSLRAAQTKSGFTPEVRENLSRKATARFASAEARDQQRQFANKRWGQCR